MNEKLEKNFRPMGSLVLIKRSAPVTQIGAIKLADRSISRSRTGTVLAVGPGSTHDGVLHEVPLKPGDTVMFDEMANRFAMLTAQNTMAPISEEFADYALVPEIGVFGTM